MEMSDDDMFCYLARTLLNPGVESYKTSVVHHQRIMHSCAHFIQYLIGALQAHCHPGVVNSVRLTQFDLVSNMK